MQMAVLFCGLRRPMRIEVMEQMGRAVKNWSCVAVAAMLMPMLSGCAGFFVPQNNSGGSGSSTANSGDFVYVANANPSTASVAAFSLSSSGTLTTLSGAPYALTFIPTSLAVSPDNTHLYVGGTTGLYLYDIGTDGSLTAVSNAGSSVPVGSIAISPDGTYLFVLQSNVIIGTTTTPTTYAITVDEYSIASNGLLTLVATPAYSTSSGVFTPQQIRVSPNGGYVMASLGSAGDIVFTLSSGNLSNSDAGHLPGIRISSDNALVFGNSTSGFVYVARSGVSTGLVEYSVASGGVLSQVGNSLGSTGNQPASVALDSTGKFAYVANRGDGTISALSVTTTASPAALSGSPFSSGANPTSLGLDNSGKFLLAVSLGGSPDLEVYSVASGGTLAKVNSAATGTDPVLAVAVALTH